MLFRLIISNLLKNPFILRSELKEFKYNVSQFFYAISQIESKKHYINNIASPYLYIKSFKHSYSSELMYKIHRLQQIGIKTLLYRRKRNVDLRRINKELTRRIIKENDDAVGGKKVENDKKDDLHSFKSLSNFDANLLVLRDIFNVTLNTLSGELLIVNLKGELDAKWKNLRIQTIINY